MDEPALKRAKASDDLPVLMPLTKSAVDHVNWELCIICQKRRRTKGGGDLNTAKINGNSSIKDTIEKSALALNDEAILLYIQDKDFKNKGKYHKNCLANLMVNADRAKLDDKCETKRSDIQTECAYKKICEYVQNEVLYNGCIVDMNTLLEMYKEWSGQDVYKGVRLKQKLMSTFGPQIQFDQRYNKTKSELLHRVNLNFDHALRTIGPGGDNFTQIPQGQCQDIHGDQIDVQGGKNNYDEINKHLREVFHSSKETRRQMLNMTQNLPWPPRSEHITSQNVEVPALLYNYLAWMISSTKEIPENGRVKVSSDENRKILNIAQDIIYATTNGSYKTPKIIGMSMAMRKLSVSKNAINLLGRFGQTMAYTQVLDFEKLLELRVICGNTKGVILPSNTTKYTFSTWVWDNLDILEDTHSGAKTSHRTNGIMIQWPEEGNIEVNGADEDLSDEEDTESLVYTNTKVEPPKSFKGLSCEEVLYCDENIVSNAAKREFAWFISRLKSSQDKQRIPCWTGFNIKTSENQGGVRSIVGYCQPIEDASTKFSTVYTTMRQSQKMAKQNQQKDVVLVYDQAIYAKAVCIQWNQPKLFKNVVLRMGQFHMICNFLGVIGRRFADAGLKDIIIESGIIAEGSVKAVLEGKHYNRAIRVHKTCSEALKRILWRSFNIPDDTDDSVMHIKLKELQSNLTWTAIQSILNDDGFGKMYNEYEARWNKAGEYGPTAKLWLSYIDMVDLLKMHVRATRDGNWPLHIATTRMMLPWMWAYDHFLYGKSLSVYLCDMQLLQSDHKEAYTYISKGCFSAKRGPGGKVACDQTIEQTINKHMKTKGPGTIGFSTNPKAVERWTLIAHEKAAFYKQCLEMVGLSTEDKDQGGFGPGKTKQSEAEVEAVIGVLESSVNPFVQSEELISLVSGMIAPDPVKDDFLQAKTKGQKRSEEFIKEHLIDNTRSYYAPVKKLSLKTFSDLAKKKKLKVSGHEISMKADDRLFWKFLIIGKKKEICIEDLLSHELGPFTWSLAGDDGSLIKTKKSKLAEIIISSCDRVGDIPYGATHIFDGMAVLHSLTKSLATMKELAAMFFQAITKNTGRCSRIDFVSDLYPDLSIKGKERDDRRGKMNSLRMSIHSKDQKCPKQLKKYLAVEENKIELINFIAEMWSSKEFASELEQRVIFMNVGNKCIRICVRNGIVCKEDVDVLYTLQEEADTRMFLHASHASRDNQPIVIHSPDTDVLILACYYSSYIPGLHLVTKSEGKNVCIRMAEVEKALGIDICKALPGLHALSGCDSTSAFFGKGKQKAFHTMKRDEQFKEALKQIGDSTTIGEQLFNSCCAFVCSLYSSDTRLRNLNKLRCEIYKQKLHRGKSLPAGRELPPTSDAFELHLKRCNYQVLVWKSALESKPIIPKPTQGHGWVEKDGELEIVWTSLPPAPKTILELISCNCNGACNTKRCSCCKNGTSCTDCCTCGDICANTWVESDGEDSSEDESN